jgi:hypothetical protein
MSGFIPRHIEQPAVRQSKPACAEDLVEALRLGLRADLAAEPGTTIALTCPATRRPRITDAAARRSPIRELVQEPMNTRSRRISAIGVPGSRSM